jgi:ribosome-associated toxin RatA of RatAB toxin-antitoxin module
MTPIAVTRIIKAPIDVVFKTVADIRQFKEALPHVVRFEFLSKTESGVGTRFSETRVMRGKKLQLNWT